MSQNAFPVGQLTLANTPNAVAWARRHTVEFLRTHQTAPDIIESARLIVSEFATNAVRHPEPEAQSLTSVSTFNVAVRLTPRSVVIEVSDRDPQPPVRRGTDLEATGGRGILIVEEVAYRWGFFHLPACVGGKVVWAEVLLAAPADPGNQDQPG